jgi:hypothetical protein
MKVLQKAELIEALSGIHQQGWIDSASRLSNHGAAGNLLEDLLGLTENNLPIPNAGEWELKTWRSASTSLLTLFHLEPSPTSLKLVSQMLLPYYGWPHQEAGQKYPADELSFRQTINTRQHSDRGFRVKLDEDNRKVTICFDAAAIDPRHQE